MKSVARSYVWWPGIDKELELITKKCQVCLENRDNPPQVKSISWPVPKGPGERIHIDFLGPWNNMMFLVIIDAFSKFIYVKRMVNINSSSTISILREYFSQWGIPKKIVSDNGTSLCSVEMETFLKMNGIMHIRSAPFHPSSNGAAENLVRTFKNFLKKSQCNKKSIDHDIQRFILAYNSTEHCSTQKSPGELHLGRPLRNALDRLRGFESNCTEEISNQKKIRQFMVGESVLFRNYATGPKWLCGKIVKKLSPVTYSLVKFNNNSVGFKRHVDQIISNLPHSKNDVFLDEDINVNQFLSSKNNEKNTNSTIRSSMTCTRPRRETKIPTRYL